MGYSTRNCRDSIVAVVTLMSFASMLQAQGRIEVTINDSRLKAVVVPYRTVRR
jgi:hypothetical protein